MWQHVERDGRALALEQARGTPPHPPCCLPKAACSGGRAGRDVLSGAREGAAAPRRRWRATDPRPAPAPPLHQRLRRQAAHQQLGVWAGAPCYLRCCRCNLRPRREALRALPLAGGMHAAAVLPAAPIPAAPLATLVHCAWPGRPAAGRARCTASRRHPPPPIASSLRAPWGPQRRGGASRHRPVTAQHPQAPPWCRHRQAAARCCCCSAWPARGGLREGGRRRWVRGPSRWWAALGSRRRRRSTRRRRRRGCGASSAASTSSAPTRRAAAASSSLLLCGVATAHWRQQQQQQQRL